jgi:hypothetical protein
MKHDLLKRCFYMTAMIILLIMSLFTEDIFTSHIYAITSVLIGAIACLFTTNKNNIEYE